jgi:hypothetical protein
VDYTFNGVNADTLRHAPLEAMQFSHALQRVLEAIHNADPWYGPVYLIKVDIADGFYRLWVNTDDIPKLGVVFPAMDNMEPLVAFPLALPMGWKESPPYFCAATEMAVDLANQAIPMSYPGPHRLDSLADTLPPPDPPSPTPLSAATWKPVPKPPLHRHRRRGLAPKPLGSFDVFVDDAIGIAQAGSGAANDSGASCSTPSTWYFARSMPWTLPNVRNPFLSKKLLKGDGCWTMLKVVLGWFIDTVR